MANKQIQYPIQKIRILFVNIINQIVIWSESYGAQNFLQLGKFLKLKYIQTQNTQYQESFQQKNKITNIEEFQQSKKFLNKMQKQTVQDRIQNQGKDSEEQQCVVFKFKRAFHQQSFDEIKIKSKKIKANPQSVEKAVKNYQKRNFVDNQIMLANLFQKLELNPKPLPEKNENQQKEFQKSQNVLKAEPTDSNKQLFFLKKVEFNQNAEQSVQQIQKHIAQIRSHIRKQNMQEKLNKNRYISTNPLKGKRIKYKIIDIKQSNFVNFGGQNYEYQDLSNEYSQNERIVHNIKYDYYVLKKGQLQRNEDQNIPQIVLPQQAQYLLQDQSQLRMNDQTPQGSQSDSNRQDRSDYEYPQEDYHQGDSDKQSEEIISGGRRRSPFDSEDEDLNNSYQQEDEEEYYRQYLKRCKKMEEGDQQITYLYNMKSKYEYDSDD